MTGPYGLAVDPVRLRDWLEATLGIDAEDGVDVSLLSGGRSNLTFAITIGGSELILRRPPLGRVLPTAHDMTREFTVLAALRDTDVPVPGVEALCTDTSVIGAPFYLMRRVDGVVLRTAADAACLTSSEAAQLSRRIAEILATIHLVDPAEVGLADFGRPNGYLERQLDRWTSQWHHERTREVPAVEAMVRRLSEKLPRQRGSSLVHGDYRLDNLMLSRNDYSPLAVLDWEMSTLGDPLADLGLLMVYWADREDRHLPPSFARQIAADAGFLSRAEMIDVYANVSGRCVSDLPFYIGLGYFKLAVILEGIHRRHLSGLTLGSGFEGLGDEVPLLAEVGLAHIDQL